MAKTVVGLFRNAAEAQKVKHELVNEGYTASDIRVIAKDTQQSTTTATGSATATTTTAETSLGATISNFFRSLTGGGEDEQRYAEGVQAGGAMLSVLVPDGKEADVIALLENYGGKDVESDKDTATATAGVGSLPPASREVSGTGAVPVVQEELAVGKRQVQRGGVRVYSHLVEQPVEETIQLREEHVRVDRQSVNRPATEADFDAFKEGTIELTETAEEAVVSKTARVVEEIVVGKEASERTQTVRDTVRHTEVEVEQLGAGTNRSANGFADYDSEFRKHFETNYATSGKSYDSYAPAYQYGHTLANDPRYLASNWSAVEAGAQKDWAAKGSGKWEDFKGAVQEGWNQVRSSTGTKGSSSRA